MSELTYPTLESKRLADLRSRAALHLKAPAAGIGPVAKAANALTVLHSLASSPDTASDALALLHELQVHQVELDLQAQELHESRAELELTLHRQTELYDFLPAGYFSIDARGALQELNSAGAAMLGTARDDAHGLLLEAFLDADGVRRFRAAIRSVDDGASRVACALTLCPPQGSRSAVSASIGKDPASAGYLVCLMITDAAAQ